MSSASPSQAARGSAHASASMTSPLATIPAPAARFVLRQFSSLHSVQGRRTPAIQLRRVLGR